MSIPNLALIDCGLISFAIFTSHGPVVCRNTVTASSARISNAIHGPDARLIHCSVNVGITPLYTSRNSSAWVLLKYKVSSADISYPWDIMISRILPTCPSLKACGFITQQVQLSKVGVDGEFAINSVI